MTRRGKKRQEIVLLYLYLNLKVYLYLYLYLRRPEPTFPARLPHSARADDSPWKNQQKLAPTTSVRPEIAKCHRLELFWQKYWLPARRNIGRGNGVKHIASEK